MNIRMDGKDMAQIININSKAGKVIPFNEWKDYEGVPDHTRGALLRYRDKGLAPGGFLTSVLTNDLFGAVGRADAENIRALKDICGWIYNRMPAPAWGNQERMDDWISQGGVEGMQKSSAQEEENA